MHSHDDDGQAWLDLSEENAAFVFCSNGKTRTGIVLACLLRFCGRVDSSLEGFKDFCLKRCQVRTHMHTAQTANNGT